MHADEPCLLASRSELGYVNRTAAALRGEPEAISEEEQLRQTFAVRRERERQQRQAWQQARGHLVDGVQIVRTARPPMPKRVVSTVRVIERAISRVDAKFRGLG
jgi:hypothetical protein